MAQLQINFLSESLMRTVTIHAVIPFDKIRMPWEEAPVLKTPFKTLYLLHGIFGNYTDWISGTNIQRWAEEKNLAVIMPSGENHFYMDCEANGERYSRFIGEELPRKMCELFPLSTARKDTFIGGLSMGGFGAITNGLKYRERFGRIIGLSSALIFDQICDSGCEDLGRSVFGPRFYETLLGPREGFKGGPADYNHLLDEAAEDEREKPVFYLCCGEDDSLLGVNREFAARVKERGFACTYEEGPGAHEWDFWNRYIKKVLDWLPLDEDREGINSGNIGDR